MKDPIKVGIIGVGGTIGSTTAVLAAEPNVQLVALADPDPPVGTCLRWIKVSAFWTIIADV